MRLNLEFGIKAGVRPMVVGMYMRLQFYKWNLFMRIGDEDDSLPSRSRGVINSMGC